MSAQDPFSLFGQPEGKPKARPKKSRQIPSSGPKAEPSEQPEVILVEDVKIIIAKMIRMHDEIEAKLSDVYEKSGITHTDVVKYLDNPQNFSRREWESVAKQKEELLQKIWSMLGSEAKQKAIRKELEKKEKVLKRKGIAGRKKWISMH